MVQKHKIAVIRVATIDDEERLNYHGRLIETYFSDIETESYCIPDQYDGVHDDTSHAVATEKIIQLAKKVQDSCDGIVVSCAGDPAVSELKDALSIPVAGAGHSLAGFGLDFGDRIGVLGIREEAPDSIRRILGARFVKSIRPEGVYNTNDLLTESGRASVVAAANDLVEMGVDVILLACTGLSTIGIAKLLNGSISVPVIDPVYAEAAMINNLCNFRRNFGLGGRHAGKLQDSYQ